jgi:hypothetical protein
VHVWAHDASRVLPSRSRLVVVHDELNRYSVGYDLMYGADSSLADYGRLLVSLLSGCWSWFLSKERPSHQASITAHHSLNHHPTQHDHIALHLSSL